MDKIPRKRKAQGNEIGAPEEALPTKQTTEIDPSKLSVQNSPGKKSPEEEPLEEESPEKLPPEEEQVPENNEISIHYISTGEILDRNKIVVDNICHAPVLGYKGKREFKKLNLLKKWKRAFKTYIYIYIFKPSILINPSINNHLQDHELQ